ncbi:hypothetical protein FS749_008288 [Ceratobasidium sp. UAMH 11750]|nr:hypothetical protein FS749_008288 [Ceratobasidium sp. UAMH 11750]
MDFDFWILTVHDVSEQVIGLSKMDSRPTVLGAVRARIFGVYTSIKSSWEMSDAPLLLELGLEFSKELVKEYYPQYRAKIIHFLTQPHIRKLWIIWISVFGAALVLPLVLGFGSSVTRGSSASRYQSRVYGGYTLSNSIFAAYTRMGMGSLKEALLEATSSATQITLVAWVIQRYGAQMRFHFLNAFKNL